MRAATIFLLCAAFLICTTGLLVPLATAEAADLSFEGSLGAYSSYIWRGYRLTDDGLQLQPSATVSVGNLSMNVWADYDLDTDEWFEVDYTAAYSFDLDKISLELGYIHYDVRDGLDSDELYLSAGFDSFLSPTLTVYVDIDAGDGEYVVADISHAFALHPKASLELAASMSLVIDDAYVASDARGEEFTALFNGVVSASSSISLSQSLSLQPMVGYSFPLSDKASDAIKAGSTEPEDSFLYAALTLAVSF